MNFETFFEECVTVVCERKKVNRGLIFSRNRTHVVCDCRVIIFNIVTQQFPKYKSKAEKLLLRKRPFYYYAERVHSELMEFDKQYKSDFEFCKSATENYSKRELEFRKKIAAAIEYFGDEMDFATSFYIDHSRAEIFIGGVPVQHLF